LQAQRTGRSWRAAHSRVATTTQGCSCTYFCWTSSATCCRAWYNTGQSSRSIARLLSGDSGKKHQLKPCQRRELLLFQLLPTSLKDVVSLRAPREPSGLAKPQSTTSVSPYLPSMMLPGFKSRCRTPRLWAYSIALQTSTKRCRSFRNSTDSYTFELAA